MKILKNTYLAVFVLIISCFVFAFSLYTYNLGPTGKSDKLKEVEIKPGSIASIADTLKSNNLIKNELAFKVYLKIHNKTNLKAGTYSLSKNMGTAKIVDILAKGSSENNLKITFKEGINIRKISSLIEESTNNSLADINNTLSDNSYLQELINKYWFITDEILNKDIYYPLEGYLYPSTYYFDSKDVDVKTIITSMLDETGKQLEPYKSDIENNKMTIHELLSLASLIELEATSESDRNKIAGVFYNRLSSNMNLGSDVTTYYGVKVDMGDRALTKIELNECNNYNTRCATFKTVPISPICNSSIISVKAAIKPDQNSYYYFVADKNKKVYFNRTFNEHDNTISRLKSDGLWYNH